MSDISKITPLNSSTTYDIKALSLKSQGRVTTANFDAWDPAYRSKVTTMLASSSMNDSGTKPPCGDGYLLNFGWDTTAGWGAQLAIQHTTTPHVCVRGCNGGTEESTWGNWYWLPVATAGGVGSSTSPIYINSSGQVTACGTSLAVSITGSSASCTGNAATATKLSNTPNNTTTFLRGDNTWTNNLQGSFWAGINGNTSAERQNGVQSGAGQMYMYSQAATTANRGIYCPAHGSGGAVSVVTVDTNNVVHHYGQHHGFIDFSQGGTWPAPQNISCTGDNSEWSFDMAGTNSYWHVWSGTNSASCLQCFNNDRHSWAYKLYGAVWNDYAEFRETKEEIEPGRCIVETGKGDLILTTKRLERGCEIVSDTYGFAIGQSKKNNTPTATSGRVLAFLYEDNKYAKDFIGWPVCSGPNGTVSIMTEEEEQKYPSRIIGTISEIPDYEEWQCGDEKKPEYKKINGRIWIRIR